MHHKQGTPQLILLLGGARSGKSTFAERLAQRSGRSVAFIATATASDNEMRERIQRHRASRPASWSTIEEPYHLPDAIKRAAEQADVLLLDCMTIWLNNWLLAHNITDLEEAAATNAPYAEAVLAAVDALLAAFAALPSSKTLVVVTNEVGLGIVPAYALGRVYRDLLGLVNQRLAAAADRVYLMVAGLGVDIKRLHEEASL
jgi:adenosylcobinamide kinase/adenosylcobinamide-phosphate guanylyltransferase